MSKPLVVHISREPFVDFFSFLLDGAPKDEEMIFDADEAKKWLLERGAKLDAVEKALDYCWNFYKATVSVKNPVVPQVREEQLRF